MIFDKQGTITTVFQENITLAVFLKNLMTGYPKIKNDHLIINLFSFETLTADDLLEFLNISFVIVTDKVAYDAIPDAISLAPTLQEARDIIEMEEIERDLGL